MKLSILDPVQIPTGRTSAQAIEDSIALAQHAERLGYHRYWLVEHHAVAYEVNPAPEVLAVALAYATSKIRIGIGGVLLNNYSPYKVAETLRTLNALFPGRIDVGIGRSNSGILPDTALRRHRHMETPYDHDEQTEELLGWLGNDLPEGSPFRDIKIMPDQEAGPQPWILAATQASAKRAALLGLPLACSAFHVPENAPGAMKCYHEHFTPSKFAVGVSAPASLLAVRLIIGETQQEAERLAMPMRAAFKLRREKDIMLERLPTPDEAIEMIGGLLPAEETDWPAYVIGSPDRIKTTVDRMMRETGATELMVQDVLHDTALRFKHYTMLADIFGMHV